MNTVILGAGLAGLTTAWKLSKASLGPSITVIEKEPIVGGLAASFAHGSYMLDYGPHKIYTTYPHVYDIIIELIGNDIHTISKKIGININGADIDFPVRLIDLVKKMNFGFTIKGGIENLILSVLNRFKSEPDSTYKDYVIHHFGPTIYNNLFKPLARKVWDDPENLSAQLAKSRISPPDLLGTLRRSLFGDKKTKPIDNFYYPKEHIGEISLAMLKTIKDAGGQIICKSQPISLLLKDNKIHSISVKSEDVIKDYPADFVISTIPINNLLRIIKPEVDSSTKHAAASLQYISLVMIYIIVKRPRVLDYGWVYYPDEHLSFNRLSDKHIFSSFGLPEDRTVICAEITCHHNDDIWQREDEILYQKAIGDIEKLGLISKTEVEEYFVVRLRDVYPLYSKGFEKHLNTCLDYCNTINNLLTVGRFGLFNYSNMDHSIDMGVMAAEFTEHEGRGVWNRADIIKRAWEYRIYG